MSPPSFLDREPLELQDYLLDHARRARAPRGAEQRLLAALAVGSLAGGAMLSASTGLAKGAASSGPWLLGKWLVVGLSATLLTLGLAEGVQHLLAPPAASKASVSSVAPPLVSERPAPSAQPVALPESVVPPQTETPSPKAARGSVETTSAQDDLAREVERLKTARSALARHDAAAALVSLAAYDAEFPGGVLGVEAAALRIEAASQLGDRALTHRLAGDFLRRYPSSPLTARVRNLDAIP